MPPSQLGLPGDSMEDYTIFPIDGFVKVDGLDCRRFNVYDKNDPGSITGTAACLCAGPLHQYGEHHPVVEENRPLPLRNRADVPINEMERHLNFIGRGEDVL